MAGHSKWSNIKHKKKAEDRKRGKIFSKLSRKIRAAVREGGTDPETNVNLRTWLDKARDANMPKENVQRAIDAGAGKGENGPLQEVVYEAFTPFGAGMLIVTTTDNKNRTTAKIRNVLTEAGGSLGAPGSSSYMFKRTDQGKYQATITVPQDDEQRKNLDAMIEKLLELEDVTDIYCAIDGWESP